MIGKAIAGNGTATIPAYFGDGSPKSGELEVAMEADGAAPIKVPVQGVVTPTSTSLACPGEVDIYNSTNPGHFSGHLDPGLAGKKVRLTFTPESPNQQGFERTVTTDANGDWQHDERFTFDQFGNWRAQAHFDGEGDHKPSSSSACTFRVHGDSG